jgi:dihydroorotase (multifunctional complex type)
MQYDVSIIGGKVVFPDGVQEVNIGIQGGRIAAIASGDLDARTVVRAHGKLVLPGFIDPHVHIGFADEQNEFRTETSGAAVGGVTTVMVYYRRLQPYGADLEDFISLGASQAHVDFGLHLGMLLDEHLEEAQNLSDRFGITSFKMYTAYKDKELQGNGVRGEDDGYIVDAMEVLAKIPGAVVNVHCENDDIYMRRLQVLKGQGRSGHPLALWSWARPPIGEAEAIQRVAMFARNAGTTVYIPHVGSRMALEAVRLARQLGTHIHFETCPHYFLLHDAMEGHARYAKVNPPVRSDADRQEILAALRSGECDTVGTDHATIFLEGKQGKEVWQQRPGFPGVDLVLRSLLELVHRRELPAEALAQYPQKTARIFGLRDKGRIAVGADADIVLVDPDAARTIAAQDLASSSDLSVYEGMTFHGLPPLTMLRGQPVAQDGRLVGGAQGQYLRRGRSA